MNRQKVIVRTSVIGILANVFLAAFKAAVGTISHSIAIVLDAVNNLSDALSSVITIVGTKLAGKKPDKKHPYGHGRIEYITAMVISVIVLYAGVTSLVESIKKIIRPETPDYGVPALVIVGVAVHSETREPMMVYRALYDDKGMYVRPLDMFLSEVDREKYPDIKQKYRFEKVSDDIGGIE